MDTLTHALSGALLARAVIPAHGASVSRRDATVLGFFAAAAPDADVVFSYLSPLAYLYFHRGVTHSLIMLPLWAMALAWLWSRLLRNPAAFRTCCLVAALGIAIHILGDVITSFGTMVLAPFSDWRVKWDTTFIIDLWFSAVVVAGLLATFVFRLSRVPAIAALLTLCGYVSFQWLQQQNAVDVGVEYAAEQGLDDTQVSALPRPVSPFNWMVVVADAQRYHYAFINLRRTEPRMARPDAGLIARLDSAYEPVSSARWHTHPRLGEGNERALSEQAWQHPQFAFFRWFAAYPVLAEIERGNPTQCVWFQDLRFLTPGRDQWPFRYGMCRHGAGDWSAYQAGEGEARIPLSQ
jgi:inner membrane protein